MSLAFLVAIPGVYKDFLRTGALMESTCLLSSTGELTWFCAARLSLCAFSLI